MDRLYIYNKHIFERYTKLGIPNLSAPLLVSSKRFLSNISNNNIMYIGQETNGWVNDTNDTFNLNNIENHYDEFMIDYQTSKSIFWSFLKNATGINYNDFYKSIVWCNTLLAGKRYDRGTPGITKEFINLSLEYLLFLYDYFKPEYVINVSGPNNPYYVISTKFFKEIGSNLENKFPSKSNRLLIDDEKNIFWTYHPLNINFSGQTDEIASKILKKIKE